MITMQRFKTCFLALILICALGGSVFASFDARLGVSGYGGAAFCIPTADYLKTYPGNSSVQMPAFRTSGSYGVDVELLQLRVEVESGAFYLGGGFSYVGVSQSIAYGASLLRPYSGLGGFVQLGGAFNELFSLGLLFRALYCNFPNVNQVFMAYEIEAVPTFDLATFGAIDLSVVAPVTASIKADAVTLRLSCGLKLSFSFGRLLENKEENKGGQL